MRYSPIVIAAAVLLSVACAGETPSTGTGSGGLQDAGPPTGGGSVDAGTGSGGADGGRSAGGCKPDAGSGGSDGSAKPGRGELIAVFPSPVGYLAVDESGVYAIAGDVFRVPRAGGTPLPLGTSEFAGYYPVLTDDAVIWQDAMAIRTVPKGGGGSRVLVPESGTYGLTRDATNLYWIAWDSYLHRTSSIRTMPLAGGPITTLLSTSTAELASIAVDEKNVYFGETIFEHQANPDALRVGRFPKDGNGSVTVFANGGGGDLQLASGSLFWLAGGRWVDGKPMTEVRRADLRSASTSLFSLVPSGDDSQLLVDDRGGMWKFRECGNRDSNPRCWTTVQRFPSGETIAYTDHLASEAAMDRDYVYWAPERCELRRVAR
jgi:hypothetical protein